MVVGNGAGIGTTGLKEFLVTRFIVGVLTNGRNWKDEGRQPKEQEKKEMKKEREKTFEIYKIRWVQIK